jgi:RNA polymerase sigma-70 factor (ECF subfamily)
MGDALLTRTTLLARLSDPNDRSAWQQFVEIYGSLVYGFARQRGLQDADAADLTQEVFLALAKVAGHWHYDPQRGSFRAWLHGLTRNKIALFLRDRRGEALGTGDTSTHLRLAETTGEPSDTEAAWELAFRQQLFRIAANQIQADFAETTWLAFWRTAVEGKSGAAAAAELGLTVGAVYVARSRVLARLSKQIKRMQME